MKGFFFLTNFIFRTNSGFNYLFFTFADSFIIQDQQNGIQLW